MLENIDKEEYKNEFIARISILLKNDWERSKYESSIKSIFGLGKPKQINIENPIEFYKENRNKNNSVFNSEDLKTNFNLYKKEYKYQESCITPIFFWGYLVFTIFYIIKELLCLTIK